MGGDTMDDVAMIGSDRRIKSKKKKPYILILAIVAIVALLVAAIKFDIGKISSKYLAPQIGNVPILKNVLPKTTEEGLYETYNKDELINLLSGSEIQLEEAQKQLEDQILITQQLEKQIEGLEVFEQEHLQFKEDKQLFDEQVASINKEEFVTFYEKMYPENAQNIYSDIVKVQQLTKEQRKYASLISEMDETRAAKLLENLFQTDMDIILSILSNMETESASAILAEMDSKIASTVVKQLSPE